MLLYRPETRGGRVYKPPTYELGLLQFIYSPNCYEVTTVYINSLFSDQGRAVYSLGPRPFSGGREKRSGPETRQYISL